MAIIAIMLALGFVFIATLAADSPAPPWGDD